MLKRDIRWSPAGFSWEADRALLPRLLEGLGLQNAKGAPTPGNKDVGKDDRNSLELLDETGKKVAQSAAGLEQYMALDRPYIGFGVTVDAQVRSDATAGIGIASRHGSGRVKHLEVKWLWVQEKVIDRLILLKKHGTETNVADLGTKYLAKPRMDMLLGLLAMTLVREADASILATATAATTSGALLSACFLLLLCAATAVGFCSERAHRPCLLYNS